jgi:hypothetical protein
MRKMIFKDSIYTKKLYIIGKETLYLPSYLLQFFYLITVLY